MVAGVIASGLEASLLTAPVKAAAKCVETVSAKMGARAAAGGAVRAGSALAAVNAERAAARKAATGVAETVLKHSTPGRILAAGGATALVVGTHEVADGVQDMGEAVGEAVRENPELAGEVADRVMGPVKSICLVAGAGIVALLLWLFLPWIALFRNYSRLSAARHAKRIESLSGGIAAKADVEAAPRGAMRFGKARLRTLSALAAFAVLTALGIFGVSSVRDAESRAFAQTYMTGEDVPGKSARRARVMEKLKAGYLKSVERHYADFSNRVEEVAKVEFAKVRSGVPALTEKFGTLARCTDLFKDAVADRIKGGDRVGERIRRDLEEDYYRGLYGARDKVVACLEDLVLDLDSAGKTYRLSVESELASERLPGDARYGKFLVECSERIDAKKTELETAQNIAAVSVAIEAMLIRQTVSTVTKTIGKTAARQAATMAAGVGAAVVDGPLPVGDVIAVVSVVGCTAWTGYDVWNATKVLPGELRRTLTEVTDESERKCLGEVLACGQKAYADSLASHVLGT